MGFSELEADRDRSTESLRKTMLEYAEKQKENLREEWIDLLKRRFGEDYDREYLPQPLAEEHEVYAAREQSKRTPELQQLHTTRSDEPKWMENLDIPVSKFVEHLVGKASCESHTSENQVLDISLSKSIEHVVCEPSQKVSYDSRVSKSPCRRRSQFRKRILVKRRLHRARLKRRRKCDYRSLVLPLSLRTHSLENPLYLRVDSFNLMEKNLVPEYHHAKVQSFLVKWRYHRVWIRSSKKDPTIITSQRGIERSDVKLGKRLQSLNSLLARRNQSKHLLHKPVETVNYLSVRVGTKEKRSSILSRIGCVWEPDGILARQVLLDWLVDFYGCDRILDDVKCLSFRAFTNGKRPLDPGRANHMWIKLEIYGLEHKRHMMLVDNRGLEVQWKLWLKVFWDSDLYGSCDDLEWILRYGYNVCARFTLNVSRLVPRRSINWNERSTNAGFLGNNEELMSLITMEKNEQHTRKESRIKNRKSEMVRQGEKISITEPNKMKRVQIYEKLANLLKRPMEDTSQVSVLMGQGQQIESKGSCRGISLLVQDVQIIDDMGKGKYVVEILEQGLVYKNGCLVLPIGSPFNPKVMDFLESITNTRWKVIFFLVISWKTWWKLMIIESQNLLKNFTILEEKKELNREFGSNLWLGTRAVKEKKIKKTEPNICENDAKKVEFLSFINKARSEAEGKRLFGSYALSLLAYWRILNLNTTHGEGCVVEDDMAVIQALLMCKREPISDLMSQFLDCNLEDKVSSFGGSIDRLRIPIAEMKKRQRTRGRSVRAREKSQGREVKESG